MAHEFSRAGRFKFGTGLHYVSANAGPFLEFMTDGRVRLSPLPDDYDVLRAITCLSLRHVSRQASPARPGLPCGEAGTRARM